MTYATVDDIVEWIKEAPGESLTADQLRVRTARLTLLISSCSNVINSDCNRRFIDEGEEERTFHPPHWSNKVYTGDFHSYQAGSMYVDDELIDDSKFRLYRLKPDHSYVGVQFDSRVIRVGSKIRYTASWGWSSVPDAIKTATIMQVARIWQRPKTPAGIDVTVDGGIVYITRMDKDIKSFLIDYELALVA